MVSYKWLYTIQSFMLVVSALEIRKSTNRVIKRIGSDVSTDLEYNKCVDEDNYYHYDIDLYQYESVEIICPKLKTDISTILEPIHEGKYYNKGLYDTLIDGGSVYTNFRYVKGINDGVNLVNVTIQNEKYTIEYDTKTETEEIITMYFDCMSVNKYGDFKNTATVQINIMPNIKYILKTTEEFKFDKYKWAPDGKNLSYVKSVRLGTKLITECRKKLMVTDPSVYDNSVHNPTRLQDRNTAYILYSDITKVFQHPDISKNKHILDLTDDSRVLNLDSNCIMKLYCEGHATRTLTLVYPNYNKIKGFNINSRYKLLFGLPYGFSSKINSSRHPVISIDIPTNRNFLKPNDCLHNVYINDFKRIELSNLVDNVKLSRITNSVKILNLSEIRSYTSFIVACFIDNSRNKTSLYTELNISPVCNFSDRQSINNDGKTCSIFMNSTSVFSIKPPEDPNYLGFYSEPLMRIDDPKGICKGCYYVETPDKSKNLLVSVNEVDEEMEIRMTGDEGIQDNPIYFISKIVNISHPVGILDPKNIIKVYLHNVKIYTEDGHVKHVNKLVDESTIYYSLILHDTDTVKISCSKFFKEGGNKRLYPGGRNTVFANVKNGAVNPKSIEIEKLDDTTGYRGIEITKAADKSSKYDLEIRISKDKFITTHDVRPLYFICANDVDKTDWESNPEPYAVIAIDPGYSNTRLYGCGVEPRMFLDDTDEICASKNCKFKFDYNKKYGFHCPIEGIKKRNDLKDVIKFKKHSSRSVQCYREIEYSEGDIIRHKVDVFDEDINLEERKSIRLFDNIKLVSKGGKLTNYKCYCKKNIDVLSTITIAVNSTFISSINKVLLVIIATTLIIN